MKYALRSLAVAALSLAALVSANHAALAGQVLADDKAPQVTETLHFKSDGFDVVIPYTATPHLEAEVVEIDRKAKTQSIRIRIVVVCKLMEPSFAIFANIKVDEPATITTVKSVGGKSKEIAFATELSIDTNDAAEANLSREIQDVLSKYEIDQPTGLNFETYFMKKFALRMSPHLKETVYSELVRNAYTKRLAEYADRLAHLVVQARPHPIRAGAKLE